MVAKQYIYQKYLQALRAEKHHASLSKGSNHKDNEFERRLYQQQHQPYLDKIAVFADMLTHVEPIPQAQVRKTFKIGRLMIIW